MSYHSDLFQRIKDRDWPWFPRADCLDELDSLGTKMFQKGTMEGYLASFLIFIQLSEEQVRLLVRLSDLYVQLQVMPSQITPHGHGKSLDNLTFGQLIHEMEVGVRGERMDQIIEVAKALNSQRTGLIHRLSSQSSLEEIRTLVVRSKELHDNLANLFNEESDDYLHSFGQYSKYPEEVEELLEEFLTPPTDT